jgi:hypothetical protein
MAFKTGGRKCKFESLENRQLMAGDVMASVHAGTLFIKGDNLSNGITITAGAIPNQVIITGTTVAGSGTTVNGITNAPVAVNNVTMDMKISMKSGNDVVTIHNLTVNGTTKFKGGAGIDALTMTSSTVCGDLKVKTGGSADNVTLTATNVNGTAKIATQGDCDSVTLTGSNFGALHTNLDQDNDTLTITNTQVVTATTLEGGQGINTFVDGKSNFFGSLYIKHHLNG